MQLSIKQGVIPFLTFEGAAEVDTVEIAAHFAAQELYPSYPGQELVYKLPEPLNRVPSWIEGHIARRRGWGAYQQLGLLAYQEGQNHKAEPDSQRLRLIEHTSETAIRALGVLSRLSVGEVLAQWGAPAVDDPVATAQELSARIGAIYDEHGLPHVPAVQPPLPLGRVLGSRRKLKKDIRRAFKAGH